MTGTLTDRVGFEPPNRRALSPRRYAASLQLIASTALIMSTVVAVAVVSIGIARAATDLHNLPQSAVVRGVG